MSVLKGLQPQRVFYYFEEITKIPHGSGDMSAIASFCENFAKEHNLKCYRDNADNVVIYKDGTKHLKNAEPIILQGHLDMVCQKTEDCNIDFSKDSLEIFIDGDFIKAKNTAFPALFKIKMNFDAIQEAIVRATGEKLRPAIYTDGESPVANEGAEPVDVLISKLNKMQIDFIVEE